MKQIRFNSLSTKGPIFPEPYESKGYLLNNNPISDLAEEMLWKAARFIDSDYEKEAFQPNNNMWACLKPELSTNLQKLNWPNDFIPLLRQLKKEQEEIKEQKKLLTKEEKLKIKAEKELQKEEYGYAILDGERAPMDGFMIEAPNWIVTRGKDPRKFLWKYAVSEYDVILNIVNAEGPRIWLGKIKSDNTSTWIMKYKIKCGRPEFSNYKELNKTIHFAGSVSIRQSNNENKYFKSENILKNWDYIQIKIKEGCLRGDDEALIIYLIQQTGIRIGNERDITKQALTYGMQTLEGQHMKLIAPNKVSFNFLGKDSVPYINTIEIDSEIWNVLSKKTFKENKKIFRVNNVNHYLKQIHAGATAKNLRTVVCNKTLVDELKKKTVTEKSTEAEKIRAIFEANLEIAKTLNHQKNVGKTQKESEEKIKERIKKAKLRFIEIKKSHTEKIKKLNEKIIKFESLYKTMPEMLKEKMKEIKIQKEKFDKQLERAKLSIEKTEFNLDKKKLTADISLGTSLANYADPKIIISYCRFVKLPIERIYSAVQLKSYEFALNVNKIYWSNYPNV